MNKNILYNSKTECCGCGACANACPKNIIEMTFDEEGFLYPQIYDFDMCVNCGKCKAVCPIRHSDEIHSQFKEALAGWCMDGSGVMSASGGAAYAIANHCIAKGGVVYGVQYADNCKYAVYVRGETVSQLQGMRTSKYIQARKNDVYKQIKTDLKNGKKVLFIGLPCDTFAVKKYTEMCQGELVLVSLICHGPTSELVHKSFCEDIEKQYGSEVNSINVRYKKNGHWKPYYIYACLKNGKEYLKKFQATDYDVAFQHFKRPSCTECHFKNDHFCADILIGDYHNAQKGTASYNETGVSSILPLTEKGKYIIQQIQDDFAIYEVDLKNSISQRGIHSSLKSNVDRSMFSSALNKNGLKVACKNSDVMIEKRKTKKRRMFFWLKSTAYNILKRFKLV